LAGENTQVGAKRGCAANPHGYAVPGVHLRAFSTAPGLL